MRRPERPPHWQHARRKLRNNQFTLDFTQFFPSRAEIPPLCFGIRYILTCNCQLLVASMRDVSILISAETWKSRPPKAAMMFSLALGLVVAQVTLSSALSARAATQAAIDAVTLARPHAAKVVSPVQETTPVIALVRE